MKRCIYTGGEIARKFLKMLEGNCQKVETVLHTTLYRAQYATLGRFVPLSSGLEGPKCAICLMASLFRLWGTLDDEGGRNTLREISHLC